MSRARRRPRRGARVPPPATALAAGLVAGSAGGALLPLPALVAVPAGALALGLVGWALRTRTPTSRRARLVAALAAAALCAGLLRGGAALPPPHVTAEDVPVDVAAVVTAPAVLYADVEDDAELRSVVRLDTGEQAVLRVRVPRGAPPPRLLPGDAVRVAATVRTPDAPRNPGARDRRAAARRQGVVYELAAAGPGAVRARGAAGAGPLVALRRLGARTRDALLRRLRDVCGDGRAYGLVACLLVGARGDLDAGDVEAFRRAGAAHLLAVSGLHVVLLVGAAEALVRRVAAQLLPPRAARVPPLVVAGTLLVVYPLVCGLATPVVRAAVFLAVALVGRHAGRRTRTLDHAAVAAALIVAADPAEALAPGFHLSFAAVAGLALLTPRFREALFARTDLLARFPEALPAWRLRLMLAVARGTSASLAASVATAPVAAAVFGDVHVAAPLTNLVAVPLAGVLLPTAALASLLGSPAAALTAPAVRVLAWALRTTASAVAALPGATLHTGEPPLWALVACGALLGVGCVLRPWTRRHLLLPAAACALLVAAPARTCAPRAGVPDVLVFDVGHGLAVLLRGEAGSDVLVDAGARLPGSGARSLLPALQALGVRRLSALALSHEDADHCGAAPDVLATLPVGVVLVPDGFGGDPAGRRVLAACRAHDVPVVACARGDRFELADVRIDALHPLPGRPGPAGNEGSLVLHARLRDRGDGGDRGGRALAALLPGDLAGTPLDALAADRTLPRADVLLLPHHGRGDAAPQVALARRLGARFLVASTPESVPTDVPGALSTGRDGALRLRRSGVTPLR